MTDNDPVLLAIDDGIARITLNRPAALNALTPPLMRGVRAAFARVNDDRSVRVVVLTGAGRGFCSGADLADVASGNTASASDATANDASDTEAAGDSGSLYNDALRDIANCPVPTIARINGAAAGGGFGIALACDISIAAESAFFVATFGPRLGIVPDLGATWNIPLRVGRARALGITLLGERIKARQAEDWGLIWRCVPDDALDAEVDRIAGALRRASPMAMTRIRSTLDAAFRQDFSSQLDLEMQHQAVLIPRNMREGARAFLERREPEFDGERD
jgi:2-(1,2-epoxy-1,2-dihydrophenyl)acetyl-CoA isomerase